MGRRMDRGSWSGVRRVGESWAGQNADCLEGHMSFQPRLVQVQVFCCLLRMLGMRISCLVQVPIFQMFCCLLRKLGMRISCLVQVEMFCCLFRMLGMRISCLKGKCSTYNNRRSAAGLLRDYLGKIITRTDYLGKRTTSVRPS